MSRLPALVIILSIILDYGCAQKTPELPPGVMNSVTGQANELKETVAAEITKTPAEPILMPETPPRNPFLTEEEEQRSADLDKSIALDYLKLSAILYNSSSEKSKAIINGRILKKGDTIDNKEIIDIRPEAVILKDAATEYIVRLRNL